MKRYFACLVLAATSCAFGQGVRFDSYNVTSAKNVPVGAQANVMTLPYSTVTVCLFNNDLTSCTSFASIFSDQALTQVITQPLQSDSQGRFGFWIAAGVYKYSITTAGGSLAGTYPLSLNSPQGPQGPGGIGCGAGNCIVGAPTVTQTITQPVNTNLNLVTSGTGQVQYKGAEVLSSVNGVAKTAAADQIVTQMGSSLRTNSFNSVLYADQCVGTGLNDIGDKINACIALLPSASSGYKVGTIVLPNTTTQPTMTDWKTTVRVGPGVNLRGQGLLASAFNCFVSTCLQGDASGTSGGQYAHTVGVSQVWEGFTITGVGGTSINQIIIELLDEQNLTMRDVAADGAIGPSGTCIQLHDVNWWTERNTFINVSTLYNCTTGWRLIADTGNPFQPHPSFGYNRFLDIKSNINDGQAHAGQTAMSIEGNSFFYNSTIRWTVNTDLAAAQPPNSTMIHMQGNAEFFENELHLFGEGQSKLVLDITSATNQFTYIGQIDVAPQTNNFAAGAAITHWIDDGGFGPVLPSQFFSPLFLRAGITNSQGLQVTSSTGCTIAAGATLTTCTVTVTMPQTEPDTNYSVVGCAVDTASGGNMIAGPVRTKTTTTFQAPLYSADVGTTGGGLLKCMVIRN